MKLNTKYLGLELKNPLIVASSPLTKNLEGVKKSAQAGAGAVVLKSLFEEQISSDMKPITEDPSYFSHPEAESYIQNMGMALQPEVYLSLVEQSSQELDIPVLASLNCVNPEWWTSYAKELEAAGAAGLELNIALPAGNAKTTSADIEKRMLKILETVRHKVKIPLAVKLGREFADLPHFTQEIRKVGIDGVVLFNRYYRPDIDLDKMMLTTGKRYSSSEEFLPVLRWVALLSHDLGMDISASTGIHTEAEVIKALLAGASSVQLCSTLFRNSLKQINKILTGMEEWMTQKGFASLEDFRGSFANKEEGTMSFERLQYLKALVGTE